MKQQKEFWMDNTCVQISISSHSWCEFFRVFFGWWRWRRLRTFLWYLRGVCALSTHSPGYSRVQHTCIGTYTSIWSCEWQICAQNNLPFDFSWNYRFVDLVPRRVSKVSASNTPSKIVYRAFAFSHECGRWSQTTKQKELMMRMASPMGWIYFGIHVSGVCVWAFARAVNVCFGPTPHS